MKILIVDDSITARRVAKGFFESIGDYEIIEAQCGVSALDIIKQSSDIDLLFTDIKMPNMDGLELAKILKESEDLSHINIIFMTTEATKEHFTEAIKLGAKYFLRKPLKIDLFVSTINKIIHDIENKRTILNHEEKIKFLETLSPNDISLEMVDEHVVLKHNNTYLEIPVNRAVFYKQED